MFSPYTTPLAARKARSIFSPLNKTPGSQTCSFNLSFSKICQDEASFMDVYETALPVLVTEALASERSSDISVKLEPFGYACLVSGRHLLIWRYKLEEKTSAHCRELMLPPSDLAHKADLVHLFLTEESTLPSALAVSPEGHVRYWPNINHEGSSVDAVTDLQGQECYSLTSISPLGCILATTTSSLVIITPTVGDGHPSVICRTLTLPQGVLAGIGRKVSSFIFGVVPSQTSEAKQLNRVLTLKSGPDGYLIYVLSSNTLQKWCISQNNKKENVDQLVFEVDLERMINQSYSDEVYKRDSYLLSGLKTWSLDMQLYQSGVMLLLAGTIPSDSNAYVYYTLGALDTSSDAPPQCFSSFYLTKYELYQEAREETLLSYKLIIASPSSSSMYIYNSDKILNVTVGAQLELNEMEFKGCGNQILGSGTCDGVPLFFLSMLGIVSANSSPKPVADSSRILSSMREVTFNQTMLPESGQSLSSNLRNAMCAYCKGDVVCSYSCVSG